MRKADSSRAQRKKADKFRQPERTNLYDAVTARIITQLEGGRLPWIQPWGKAGGTGPGLPRNALTARPYSGVNVLILWGAVIEHGWPSQSWLTFRQAQAAGGCVRKGERGVTVFYADRFTPEAEKRKIAAVRGADPTDTRASGHDGEARTVPFLKRFTMAVDHFNTERPHTHIVLRGVDDRGDNLIIAREYISHGLRERASELVTLDLGPRTDREIEARLRHDVDQERLTAIDRRLLRRMDADRTVSPADNDPLQQSVAAGRLRKLRSMDLAEDIGGGRYRLADGMEETLRRMGERGDIIRVMQRELTARRLDRAGVERVIASELREPIVGKLISQGFSDEHRERRRSCTRG
jgi:hypothetical protein